MEDESTPTHSLNEVLELFDGEKYQECLDSLLYYASLNKPKACSRLGLAYHLGLGLPIDIEKAKHHLMIAANQGCGIAAHNLGTLYSTLPKSDIKKSQYWFNKAQNLGFKPGTE